MKKTTFEVIYDPVTESYALLRVSGLLRKKRRIVSMHAREAGTVTIDLTTGRVVAKTREGKFV